MPRFTIRLDDKLHREVAAEAARRDISKSALIRELVRQGLQRLRADPIDAIIGVGDGAPVDDIDQVLYDS